MAHGLLCWEEIFNLIQYSCLPFAVCRMQIVTSNMISEIIVWEQ
jgi:hypothetical protein